MSLDLSQFAELVESRISTRAYLDQPVPQEVIREILEVAKWTPSSTNMQPWQVAVVTGQTKAKLDQALLAAFDANLPEAQDMPTYPDQWDDPYKARRRACGLALYQAMQIGREDKDKARAQMRENFRAFGAPVELFFFVDAQLKPGSLFDTGMFAQTLMLAARAKGLDTCPQAALGGYPDLVKEHLGIDKSKKLLCGMALGYRQKDHPINNYRTEREQVEKFAQFFD